MRQISAEAYDSWQIIYKQMPNPGTLKQKEEWWARNEKAKSVYLNAERIVANSCYDHDYRKDY